MTKLFCASARRMRVLLWIAFGSSWAALGADGYAGFAAFTALDAAEHPFEAFHPAAWSFMGKTAVYILIFLALRLVGEEQDGPNRSQKPALAHILLLCAFAARTAFAFRTAASAIGGDTTLLSTIYGVSGVVMALGMLLVFIAQNPQSSPQSLINLFSMVAMIWALCAAYQSVTGVLDGQLGVLEGLATAPDALLGVVFGVFFGSLRRQEEYDG